MERTVAERLRAAERRYREAQRTGRGYAEALREYQAAERAAVVVLQGDEAMSLDVYLMTESERVPCVCECGHEHERERADVLFSRNITHNVGRMADKAGLYRPCWRPDEIGITRAVDLVPLLERGLDALRLDPGRFREMNPSNGWGSYEGLVSFVEAYLTACREHPDARVSVSR